MTFLEFLVSQLGREITPYDNQRTITEDIEFWQLCIEAKRLFLEEKQLKQERQNDTDK